MPTAASMSNNPTQAVFGTISPAPGMRKKAKNGPRSASKIKTCKTNPGSGASTDTICKSFLFSPKSCLFIMFLAKPMLKPKPKPKLNWN